MTARTTMTGEMVVGIDNAWVYKVDIKGKSNSEISMSMGERSIETNSNGTLEVLRQVIFAQPKAAPAN